MPSVRDIRRRIRSVENTGKVTNAMSLIAASKMRRAQNAVLQGRPYADKILDVIAHLAHSLLMTCRPRSHCCRYDRWSASPCW